MSWAWVQPIAFVGLATLIVPVLLHWLARAERREMAFPTLRFLRQAHVSARRRRALSDWPLLLTRLLILASAVAALAGPSIVTTGRRAAWATRTARALVVAADPSAGGPVDSRAAIAGAVSRERSAAFASAVFEAAFTADAVRDATDWLEAQPPAAREIVVVGCLRHGLLRTVDLDAVPPHIGVRFVPVADTAHRSDAEVTAVSDGLSGSTSIYAVRVTAEADRTRVRYVPVGAPSTSWLDVRAGRPAQAEAEAVRRAVIAEGVFVGPPDRALTIVFDGADAADTRNLVVPASAAWMRRTLDQIGGVSGGERDGRLVVVAGRSISDPTAPALVAQAARLTFAPEPALDRAEPRMMTAETLGALTRLPTPQLDPAALPDVGDRRWAWMLALALLAIEGALRRTRRVDRAATDAGETEARVA
jgi:hypothetical protein